MTVRGRLACLGSSGILFALVVSALACGQAIRSLEVDDASVAVIHTAIGYSTILEFQSRPISAVLGDQDAFKVEFVANSITIKPLVPHAKSNVFIFTEYERFNCQLVAGPPAEVDFIVRIHSKAIEHPAKADGVQQPLSLPDEPAPFVTRTLHRSASYDGFGVTLTSMSQERDISRPRAVTLLEFELGARRSSYAFQASALGVKQGGRFLILESLYLDSLELTSSGPPVRGKLALLSQDFNAAAPVTLVFVVPQTGDPGRVHRIEVSTASPHRKPKAPASEILPITLPKTSNGSVNEKGK